MANRSMSKNLARRAILQGLNRFGFLLTRATSNADLIKLLVALRPIDNGVPLVRIGGEGDGGYLLPDDFDGIQACFSPGVDQLWTFEKHLLESFSVPSHLCDSIDKKPNDLVDGIDFHEFWIGPVSSKSARSLSDWVSTAIGENKNDLILQMDIEGGEFPALFATPDSTLQRFRMIVIELHFLNQFRNKQMWDQIYRPLMLRILQLFDVVHVHPNNCCGSFPIGDFEFPKIIELTLHRKDRSKGYFGYRETPHPLDSRCVPRNRDIEIPWNKISEQS